MSQVNLELHAESSMLFEINKYEEKNLQGQASGWRIMVTRLLLIMTDLGPSVGGVEKETK